MVHYKEQYFLSEGEKEELKLAIQLIPKEKRHEVTIVSIITKHGGKAICLFWKEEENIEKVFIQGQTAGILVAVLEDTVGYAQDLIIFCKTHTPDLYQELFQS